MIKEWFRTRHSRALTGKTSLKPSEIRQIQVSILIKIASPKAESDVMIVLSVTGALGSETSTIPIPPNPLAT
jgi:hypothetical protein